MDSFARQQEYTGYTELVQIAKELRSDAADVTKQIEATMNSSNEEP